MDGILNITYFRELRAQGMDIAEAVFHGAEQRMRPMLMTALSACVGCFRRRSRRHRQPGAAAAGDRGRGRHAARSDHAAGGRAEVHVTATGAVAPVTGINGTTMGHAGVGGIGGPAKDRSAIGGSTYRRF
jgi:hypothetical protein